MRKSLLRAFFLLTSTALFSQQYVTTRDFDRISKVSAGFGLNTYFGELRKANNIRLQPGLSFSVGYEHLLTGRIALRASLSIYKIQADDALSSVPANKIRNLSFYATNTELTIQTLYYLFSHPAPGYRDRASVNPYFHLGLGVTSNNPKTKLAGTRHALRPLSLEGVRYSGLTVAIPIGIGASFFISRYLDLQLELQYTMTLTGYLDDVSGAYRDPSTFSATKNISVATLRLLSDPRTALKPPVKAVPAGTPRGNRTNDAYLRFGFRLGFYLPKSLYGKSSIRCKAIRRTK